MTQKKSICISLIQKTMHKTMHFCCWGVCGGGGGVVARPLIFGAHAALRKCGNVIRETFENLQSHVCSSQSGGWAFGHRVLGKFF